MFFLQMVVGVIVATRVGRSYLQLEKSKKRKNKKLKSDYVQFKK